MRRRVGLNVTDAQIAAAILDAAVRRGKDKTLCPSEVARAFASDWRPLMDRVRRVASDLALKGDIAVTQKGKQVDPRSARGPIRLGLPSSG
ncbi:MAG: DUF3253 domain-containing protein [Paracoccaceae bacterium]